MQRNALNKQIGEKRKVRTHIASITATQCHIQTDLVCRKKRMLQTFKKRV